MVLSDGGGWNDDAAAGCPAVVVVGAVGAAGGVGVGVGAGSGRVAVRAGAAGAARRAGFGFGASTVTCGIVTVGAAPVGGVSGVGCEGCGAGVSAGGVSGAVVAGGASGGGAGVCEDATPAKQSSTSAELLSRSQRLLRIDITSPPTWTGTIPSPRRSTHHGENSAAWGIGAAVAGARPGSIPPRCQAIGGARARNSAPCNAVKPN
jgi:hypothetical protein